MMITENSPTANDRNTSQLCLWRQILKNIRLYKNTLHRLQNKWTGKTFYSFRQILHAWRDIDLSCRETRSSSIKSESSSYTETKTQSTKFSQWSDTTRRTTPKMHETLRHYYRTSLPLPDVYVTQNVFQAGRHGHHPAQWFVWYASVKSKSHTSEINMTIPSANHPKNARHTSMLLPYLPASTSC